MLIDTHAHLWFPDYKDDLEEVLERAKAARVEKIIVPGTNIESSKQAVELAKEYPGIIYAAVGVHPEDWREGVPARADFSGAVAVGEIGTDKSNLPMQQSIKEQMELFRVQCELAVEMDLPVIIHTRDSFAETWEVLSSLPQMPRGQFHCFSVDEEALEKVLASGFYVSFCKNFTWSKRVAKLVPLVPPERLLLETDAPFMDPGKRNEPANVRELLEQLAILRNETSDNLEKSTSENARRVFRL